MKFSYLCVLAATAAAVEQRNLSHDEVRRSRGAVGVHSVFPTYRVVHPNPLLASFYYSDFWEPRIHRCVDFGGWT